MATANPVRCARSQGPGYDNTGKGRITPFIYNTYVIHP
uniref:Uncharacterized protein n=1 Tax=Anguilla anguilla TaxID=7936 RepID=A0A0E9PLL3_ANGAN